MTTEGQVTPPENQGNVPAEPASLGWRAALPDEYKDHADVKTYQKPGDFVKSALEIKADRDALKTRLEGAIFKPGADAKPEDVAAYQKALGVPDDPKEYEFPPVEGVEHDEQMMEWARNTFKTANLSKEQAATISQAWDGFMGEMAKAQSEAAEAGVKAATEALQKEWTGDTYNTNIEITKRGFQAFEKIVPGFQELLDTVDVAAGVKLGNDPRMLKVFHAIGAAIGDDMSLPSARPIGEPPAKKDFTAFYEKKS